MTERFATVPMIKAPGLTDKDYRIWMVLCSFNQWKRIKGKPYSSKEGTCFPAIERIAKEAECSARAVQRSVEKLERLGFLIRTPRHGKTGEQRSNEYTLFAVPRPPAKALPQ